MGVNLGPLNIKDTYEGLVQISGSQLTDGSGSLISSLDITASQAGTAGYAGTAGTASNATSASFADQSGTSGFASTATSASFATTASYALNVPTFDTGSLLVTGSVTDATITLEKGDGSTFDLVVDNVANATSASFATTASHAIFAETASFLPADTNLNINSITASFATFTSASIGYLQTITGSAKIIGDAFIILNNNLPTERYAGLVVQDSGSGSPLTTSSLQYDGQTDDWFYEYSTDGGVTTDHGVAMFGPEYSVKGVPTYLTNNTIPKGDGGHHLNDSSITDDGTDVVVNANISASGFVSASTYYGDGSNLSGISSDPFPYTGSAEITGSLEVIGDIINGTGPSDASINIEAIGGANTISTDGGNAAGSVTIGQSNTSGKRDVVIGIDNSSPQASNGSRQVVIGHTNIIVSPDFTDNNTIIGVDNTVSGIGGSNVVLGTNINLDGGSSHVLIGNGVNYDPTGGQGCVIIGGGGANSFTVSSNYGVLVGGFGNAVNANKGGGYGGESNDSNGEYAYFIGGDNNNATGNRSIILGGSSNTTTAAAPYGAIVGGQSNTSGHDRSVVVGGTGLSTTKDDEAVVNHLSIYGNTFISSSTLGTGSLIDNLGQNVATGSDAVNHIVHLTQADYDALTPDANTLYVIDGSETLGDTVVSGSLIGEVNTIPVASNTGSLDCSLGNMFILALVGGQDVRLEASNVQQGQVINIRILNDTTEGTISFDTNVFKFEGGTPFTATATAGAIDILTTTCFNNTSYLYTVGVKDFQI